MKKLFFASALFLLAIFLTPKVALAQGTCGCLADGFGGCMNPTGCTSGYTPTCVAMGGYCGCDCKPYPTSTPTPVCLPDGTQCFSLSVPHCSDCCNGYHVVRRGPGDGASICGAAPTPTPGTGGNTDLWCDSDKTQLNTAIGCIPILTTKEAFLSFILKWAVGIGGGIAFLLIIYAGFMIMTSAGNPERLKAGQELLTSAISGLILLIFSVVILKIIGVDILELGQWGFGK